MTFKELSKKQRQIFKWCHGQNKDKYKCILCDGAIRSGKTICMITSFIIWAMNEFNGNTFAICSKTVASCERNIIMPLLGITDIKQIYSLSYRRSDHLLTVSRKGKKNYFYIFGGKDESSYTLIQGLTLSGVLLDEVALMPRSFVEQALARTISVENARYWFNCNPENPKHFIKTEWVDDADGENRKRILHLHFLLEDNPTITESEIEETKRLYTGVFYDRYIKGLWVKPEGLVYPEFSSKNIIPEFKLKNKAKAKYYVSIDYGTSNPCSMGLWAVMTAGGAEAQYAIRIKEYYWSSAREQKQKTDEEYYAELEKLCNGYQIETITVDPSAASFIALIIKNKKFKVIKANNDVIDGIRYTSGLIKDLKIRVCQNCRDNIREYGLYVWNDKSDKDSVIKKDDHSMDDTRYFAYTILKNLLQTSNTVYKNYGFGGGWE